MLQHQLLTKFPADFSAVKKDLIQTADACTHQIIQNEGIIPVQDFTHRGVFFSVFQIPVGLI